MILYTTNTILSLALLAYLLFIPSWAQAAVLTTDTVWKGDVVLPEDILVPQGVTLTIAPGTVIRVESAESTKTDPEYLSPLVEIAVRGVLKAEGTKNDPISITSAEEGKENFWGGIIIDGGSATLSSCRISNAETAVSLLGGSLQLEDSLLSGNRYGLSIQGLEGSLRGKGNRVTANDYGVVVNRDSSPPTGVYESEKNIKRDILRILGGRWPGRELPFRVGEKNISRSYKDEVLKGETVWRERVTVDGTVRLPEESRLVIMPGTVVEFLPRDTNNDGIGESGLLVQGVIVARGTADAPIVFRSAGNGGVRGSWDAINIMNSSGAWNLMENCRIEDAYRGLHFHFSRVAVTDSVLRNCYRGMQFQESQVLIRGNRFFDNRSAAQGRDSEVVFSGNAIHDNFQGINFFRVRLDARKNMVAANGREGLRIREGATIFEENLIDGNRYGLLVMDAYYGAFSRNVISNNGEIGLSLKNCDNLEITANLIAGNGENGINLQQSGGRIRGNLISDNGARGVAVQSFSGVLEENNLVANGEYAVDMDGPADLFAPRNWWGGDDPERAVFDRSDDENMGRVNSEGAVPVPYPFQWPLAEAVTDHTLRGDVAITGTLKVAEGATLKMAPGARILFAEKAGLAANGRIVAVGEKQRPIYFTSTLKRDGAWDELLLEHADGSIFENCIVEYATWGLHSHFTRLLVKDSVFRLNGGGMRFRSGPVEISGSTFRENGIGIRSYRGNAVISGTEITGNGTGIFVREKGGGLAIHGNNIFANNDYNVRVGDFNDEDIAAEGNWWGEGDPLTGIFDGRSEPGIGSVLYEPSLEKPLMMESR